MGSHRRAFRRAADLGGFSPHPGPGPAYAGQAPAPGYGTPPPTAPAGYPYPPQAEAPPSSGNATRVDVTDKARAIGNQIAATQKGFLPYDQLPASNAQQLSADYERFAHVARALAGDRASERDPPGACSIKILLTIFTVRARRPRRAVLDERAEEAGARREPAPRRDRRSDPRLVDDPESRDQGTRDRADALTQPWISAASKGKSMILNRISSAIVALLLHNDEILGVLWLDSETLANFQPKDMEIVTAIAAQAEMFIEINILGKKIEREIVTASVSTPPWH